MILGYHLIFTAYGFWLPNDPRGSWSDFIRSWDLLRHGRATKTCTRRSVAGRAHDVAQRRAAKQALRHPPVLFDGRQALVISRGFAAAIEQSGYTVHACSILPDHVHLVVARHRQDADRMIGHFKGAATLQLKDHNLHPMRDRPNRDGSPPSPWARKGWKVFLDSAEGMRRSIRYVERNPVKDGKPPQRWSFVAAYRGGSSGGEGGESGG